MSKAERELAELMEWKPYNYRRTPSNQPTKWLAGPGKNIVVSFNDGTALAEVWKVLYEEGLWTEFEVAWKSHYPILNKPWVYVMLTDHKGQIEAARDVLREDAIFLAKRRAFEGPAREAKGGE